MHHKWFFRPALFYFLLTLVSGVWLRYQWAWPQNTLVNLENLIHAHSHVAILGWLFLGITGILFQLAVHHRRGKKQPGIVIPAQLSIVVSGILFPLFMMYGYALATIALSTVHLFLSYYFAAYFIKNNKLAKDRLASMFFEGSMFWLVIASAGTWMLALGRGWPPFILEASVQFYLHILFNGWMVFALAGLAFYYLDKRCTYRPVWIFWFITAGVLLSFLNKLNWQEPSIWIYLAGLSGELLYAGAGLSLLLFVLSRIRERDLKGNVHCPELLWYGMASAMLMFLLPVALIVPEFRELWQESHFLVIGFIHLQLLSVVSTLLLFMIIQRQSVAGASFMMPHWYRILRVGSKKVGVWLYIGGSLLMVMFLFFVGISQIYGFITPFPVQKTLFYLGLIAVLGAKLLLVSIAKPRNTHAD